MNNPKHTKITKYENLEDGSIKAVTESYFDELSSRKEDIIKSIKTDHNNYFADWVSCLDVIKSLQTKDLLVRLTLDEWNVPTLIVKQYTIKKDNYKRR